MAVMAQPMKRRRWSVMRRREAIAGYLFILPWLIGLIVFTAYPILATVYFSFTDYNIIQPPHWVGLSNYTTMFTADTDFWNGVGNSLYYALISVPLGLAFSLGLALVLNLRARGVGVYRALFYLPALAPSIVATVVFLMLLDPQNGLVNVLLRAVGLPAPGWFEDPSWSKPALIILSLWGAGTAALIFLAGLQEIPQALIEAATIDGAGAWSRFWNVTLPLLSPVVLFNLVMGVIWSFQVFDQAITVGGTTGDPLGSTLMFMVMIYNNAFRYFSMGYASALSVVLVLAILVVTAVIFRTSRLWVFYEGQQRDA
ncbi:MAG TPA: sugar ABC transporter permease [Chloroflexota bacterium]|nr:sugar ABC transporter permease [Chloroflexota bacterium]